MVADLEVYCLAILADMKAQEAEKRLVDKEQEWEDFVALREEAATAGEDTFEEDFEACPSPLTSPKKRAEWVPEWSSSPQGSPVKKGWAED